MSSKRATRELTRWRIEQYGQLAERIGRPPTAREFALETNMRVSNAFPFMRKHGLEMTPGNRGRKPRSDESYREIHHARKEKYDSLVLRLGRLPSRTELAREWEVSYSTVNTYVSKWPDIVVLTKGDVQNLLACGRIGGTIHRVMDEIWQRHHIVPSLAELARLYRISKQRVEQVTKREGIKLREAHKPILWDVDIPKCE